MTMNADQLAVFDRAGELARIYNEARTRRLQEPAPDRPWFFHPLGYWIDFGYNRGPPEYDKPSSNVDPRTANFARLIGGLSRTTRIWQDKDAMATAREFLPPYLDYESRRLTDKDMANGAVPAKPDQKDDIVKEAEWRQQWKVYNDQYSGIQADHKVRLLLKWFKEDFFHWLNSPECILCKAHIPFETHGNLKGETEPAGVVQATEEEKRYTARNVELFRCTTCGFPERFPRYNDPIKLLSTRRGRCGEFANCFALLVRATGVPTRWVWNSEDHVWVEYFSTAQNRWIHLDPCENAYDDPLLYARNWRKKMAYCIAFDEFGGMDVSRRYVRRPQEEGKPRGLVREEYIPLIMQILRNIRRTSLKMVEVVELEKRDHEEEQELNKFIEDENKPTSTADQAAEVQSGVAGRQTGTAEWKRARGEDGTRP